MRTVRTDANRYFHIPSFRQIETFEGLINEINSIVAEAKASANYKEFSHLIDRALSGVLISNDGTYTMVELARNCCDRALYSTTIKMLIRAKESVKNILEVIPDGSPSNEFWGDGDHPNLSLRARREFLRMTA